MIAGMSSGVRHSPAAPSPGRGGVSSCSHPPAWAACVTVLHRCGWRNPCGQPRAILAGLCCPSLALCARGCADEQQEPGTALLRPSCAPCPGAHPRGAARLLPSQQHSLHVPWEQRLVRPLLLAAKPGWAGGRGSGPAGASRCFLGARCSLSAFPSVLQWLRWF